MKPEEALGLGKDVTEVGVAAIGVLAAAGLGINPQTKMATASPEVSDTERTVKERIWRANLIGVPLMSGSLEGPAALTPIVPSDQY